MEVDEKQEVSLEEKLIFNKIEKIQHDRHDLLHLAVCQHLNIPFGEKKIEDHLNNFPQQITQQMKDQTDWLLIKNQTPDILLVNHEEQKCKIIDISVSNEQLAIQIKKSKYDLLRRNFINVGYQTEIIPIVYDPVSGNFVGSDELQISENIISKCRDKIDSLTNELRAILGTDAGRKWRIMSLESYKLKESLTYSDSDLESDLKFHKNIPFNNMKDLSDVVSGNLIIPETKDFLDFCLSEESNLKYKLTDKVVADIKSFWDFHKYNSIVKFKTDIVPGKEEYAQLMINQNSKFRSYLPLPNLDGFPMEFEDRRDTKDDSDKVKILLSYCLESSDLYVNHN